MPERDDTAGVEYPPPLPDEDAPELLPLDVAVDPLELEVAVEFPPPEFPPPEDALADAAAACSRHATQRLLGATLFLLGDQLAERRLGVGAGLGVLLGESLGLGLRVGERGGELVGLFALARQLILVVVELGHERVEFVGRDVAGTQCDAGEFFTLDGIVEVLGVLEQRTQRHGSATDERSPRHVGQAAAQLVEHRFLLGDIGLGIGDLDGELVLGVDRLVVVLTELAGALFEPFEFVDDVLDALALLVDALGLDDGGDGSRDGEGDGEGDGKAAQDLLEKVPHSSKVHPSECDERVANG